MEVELTAKDICSIIRACKSSGVKKFKLSSLEFDLEADSSVQLRTPYWGTNAAQDDTNQMAFDHDEANMQLALENPVEWEKMQLEGQAHGSI